MNSRLLLLILFLLCFSVTVHSATSIPATGGLDLGAVATQLMEPVSVLGDFLNTACLVIGISFIFAGVVKYSQHRNSPLEIPISTVVFLFIAGVALLLLPLAYMLAGDQAAPYSERSSAAAAVQTETNTHTQTNADTSAP